VVNISGLRHPRGDCFDSRTTCAWVTGSYRAFRLGFACVHGKEVPVSEITSHSTAILRVRLAVMSVQIFLFT
jgi:hypothetical protein